MRSNRRLPRWRESCRWSRSCICLRWPATRTTMTKPSRRLPSRRSNEGLPRPRTPLRKTEQDVIAMSHTDDVIHRTEQPNTSEDQQREPRPVHASVHGGDTAPVSVVVPCFRCAHTIGQAVASVAAQVVRPAEVLLVDDGSGDGTLETLWSVARDYPPGWIKVVAMPRNGGPSAARNRGWEQASQPWIAFLDADDTWHPQKLKLQMKALADDPKIALIAHEMNVQSRSAPAPALHYPLTVRVLPRHLLMLRSPLPTASIVLRRDLPFRFDEARWRAEDFMLWAQILLSGYRCAKLNQVL